MRTRADVLRDQYPNYAELERQARDPRTTPEVLDGLLAYGPPELRDVVAVNPNLGRKQLTWLIAVCCTAVCHNPILPLLELEDPVSFQLLFVAREHYLQHYRKLQGVSL